MEWMEKKTQDMKKVQEGKTLGTQIIPPNMELKLLVLHAALAQRTFITKMN